MRKSANLLTGWLVVLGLAIDERVEAKLWLRPLEKSNPEQLVWEQLGLRLQPVDTNWITLVKPQIKGGTEVDPNGIAAAVGFQPGEVLIGLHTWQMFSLADVTFVLAHPDCPAGLHFVAVRDGQARSGRLNRRK